MFSRKGWSNFSIVVGVLQKLAKKYFDFFPKKELLFVPIIYLLLKDLHFEQVGLCCLKLINEHKNKIPNEESN